MFDDSYLSRDLHDQLAEEESWHHQIVEAEWLDWLAGIDVEEEERRRALAF